MARKATTDWAAKTLDAGKKDHTFFDDTLPGFGLRVRAGGSRMWVVQYKIGGRHRRMVLGSAANLNPDKARKAAMDVLVAVRHGTDVAAERIRKRSKIAHTFAKPLRDHLGDKKLKLKPRSYAEVERHLLGHAKPLHKHEVEAIKRSDIATLLRTIANERGPFAANRVRASLSAYFGWMIGEGLVEANPVSHTNKCGRRQASASACSRTMSWPRSGGHSATISTQASSSC